MVDSLGSKWTEEEIESFLNKKFRREGFTNGINFTKENYEIIAPIEFSSSPIKFPKDLAESINREEILAICYHEIAHIKYRHWLKGMLLFLAIFIPYIIFVNFLLGFPLISIFGIFISIVGASISLLLVARLHRNLEHEADEYSSSKTSPEILLSALKKYNKWRNKIEESTIPFFEKVVNLPPIKRAIGWLQTFSHPTFKERKENLIEDFD